MVVDAPLEYRTEIDTAIAGMTGYQIDRHRIIVEGVCPKYQKECEKDGRQINDERGKQHIASERFV